MYYIGYRRSSYYCNSSIHVAADAQSLCDRLEVWSAPASSSVPPLLRGKPTRTTACDIADGNVVVAISLPRVEQRIEKTEWRSPGSDECIVDIGQNPCSDGRGDTCAIDGNTTTLIIDLEFVPLRGDVGIRTTIRVVKALVLRAEGGKVARYCEGLMRCQYTSLFQASKC